MTSVSMANAIINQRDDWVEQLIQNGADVNQVDEYGFTPIIQAAIVDNLKIAKLLLSAQADANQTDMVGSTALHWAVSNDSEALAKLLLSSGADANIYTQATEPPLVKAILSRQRNLVKLLHQHGADERFANDFIHIKLLAHRFQLRGHVDLVDPAGFYHEMSYEGFFPDATLGIIISSLSDYLVNYAARKTQKDFIEDMSYIVGLMKDAQSLLKYSNHLIKRATYRTEIKRIVESNHCLLPVTCAGHYISLIRWNQYLAICDRRKTGEFLNGIMIYQMTKPQAWQHSLCDYLLYEKKEPEYIENEFPKILGLVPVTRIMIAPQMTGNCSWANLEAGILASLFLLREKVDDWQDKVVDQTHATVAQYRHWRDWDKERALQFMTQDFELCGIKRQAMLASVFVAIVFQRCSAKKPADVRLARRLAAYFHRPEFLYLEQSYRSVYVNRVLTSAGRNFDDLLRMVTDFGS